MLEGSVEAAYVSPPSRRGSDPRWLEGIHAGRRIFILGGAKGVADAARLPALRGAPVIGTNWTLRHFRPTYWNVVDLPVWKSEAGRIVGDGPPLVVLVSKGVLGRKGPYSVTEAGLQVKHIGRKNPTHIVSFDIKKSKGGKRVGRAWVPNAQDPFLPKSYLDEFHNGFNSLCFCIQHAHLMGASEIVCLGFTLKSGSPYESGRMHPIFKKPSIYVPERSIDWLAWFAKMFPGRVRLGKGWSGPLYDAKLFEEIDLDTPKGLTPNLPWDWTRSSDGATIPAP